MCEWGGVFISSVAWELDGVFISNVACERSGVFISSVACEQGNSNSNLFIKRLISIQMLISAITTKPTVIQS